MKNKETLKQIYHLQYDSFAFKSGLINWYNSLLDKTPDELDENDINLMVGYSYNGELLLVLSNLIGSDYFSPLHLLQLKNIISKFYGNMLNASTMSDEEKKLFIATMKFIMSY